MSRSNQISKRESIEYTKKTNVKLVDPTKPPFYHTVGCPFFRVGCIFFSIGLVWLACLCLFGSTRPQAQIVLSSILHFVPLQAMCVCDFGCCFIPWWLCGSRSVGSLTLHDHHFVSHYGSTCLSVGRFGLGRLLFFPSALKICLGVPSTWLVLS